MENIKQALTFHFKSKEKPIELNYNIISAAAKWAEEHLGKTDPYVLEPMEKTDGYIMADGNTAGAIGSIYGGVHFVSWYPITPGSSLPEAVIQYLPMLRKDPVTGKNTYAVIQAEDELSAIGMCIGAGWTGLRAMTSTSGPGISLMAEYAGLAYLAEVPLVIWDVQRMGPSTGLPTRTSQGDINLVYFLGHGDTKHVVLLPGSVSECFEFGWRAFDLAEELQTLVFVLSDLDLAMNQWMTEPFEYPDEPINRGKILWEDGIDEFEGIWGRYLDIDDDGIPYRTVPGNRNPKSSYFARGTGHDEFANYSEDAEVWTRNMARLSRKFETARKIVPKPEIDIMADAEVGIIAFGSTHNAISEARIFLNENGVSTDYLRLRALPFTEETIDFVKSHRRVYVIEMNRDGQLHQLLTIETPELAGSIKSIKRNNGLPLTAKWIKKEIITLETS